MPTGTRERRGEGNLGPKQGAYKTLQQVRSEVMHILCKNMSPRDRCLSLVLGDFNTVVTSDDRLSLSAKEHHRGDDAEEAEWRGLLERPFGLYGIRQDLATYQAMNKGTISCRSRIDRFYTNQSASDQIDKEVEAHVLDWPIGLSAHRPLLARRATRAEKSKEDRHIPEWVCSHSEFPQSLCPLHRLVTFGGSTKGR